MADSEGPGDMRAHAERPRPLIHPHPPQQDGRVVRKKPAINHQPPCCKGGKAQAVAGAGGSSASQNSWRMNCTGSQFTEAHMFSPMISKAMKPQISEATPRTPR